MAVGSLRHVFPTRAELLEFSAELMVQQATDRILALPHSGDAQQYALAVLLQLLHLLMQSPSEDSDWAIEILREELARITPGTPA